MDIGAIDTFEKGKVGQDSVKDWVLQGRTKKKRKGGSGGKGGGGIRILIRGFVR